jgi:tryptophan halogenase
MSIPDSLQHRLDLYAGTGRVFRDGLELFAEVSWVQVMAGQGVVAKKYHPLVDLQSEETVQAYLGNIESVVGKCVAAMPTHADFVRTHCAELAATP